MLEGGGQESYTIKSIVKHVLINLRIHLTDMWRIRNILSTAEILFSLVLRTRSNLIQNRGQTPVAKSYVGGLRLTLALPSFVV